MAKNTALGDAKKNKKDEFYTRYEDIQAELNHYEEHFAGKTVLCNCDDPFESNFCKYFLRNFNHLGLKRLICTSYGGSSIIGRQMSIFDDDDAPLEPENGYVMDIKEVPMQNGRGVSDEDIYRLLTSKKCGVKRLKDSGDFRSEECIKYLKQADIVVTNPPFSLFREYVAQLVAFDKKFLIIGNQTAITYKDFFPLLKNNLVWMGYNAVKEFTKPDGTTQKFGNVCWYTNLDLQKRHEELILFKRYYDNEEDYPRYDNYDAINVDRIADIPCDYFGIMGVSISFLDKYNPEQFEILDITDRDSAYKTKQYTKEDSPNYSDLNRRGALIINGIYKSTFARMLIKRRQSK